MIQATDLRIGNYLTYHGDTDMPCKIDAQDIYNIELNYMFNAEIHSPIPLTEEILLKCGFDKCEMDGDYWFEYRNEPLRLVSNDTIFNNNTDKWVIGFDYYEGDTEFLDNKIQYLHQLQNLYYALTNTELKITL